jgi:hypothetical protein
LRRKTRAIPFRPHLQKPQPMPPADFLARFFQRFIYFFANGYTPVFRWTYDVT